MMLFLIILAVVPQMLMSLYGWRQAEKYKDCPMPRYFLVMAWTFAGYAMTMIISQIWFK